MAAKRKAAPKKKKAAGRGGARRKPAGSGPGKRGASAKKSTARRSPAKNTPAKKAPTKKAPAAKRPAGRGESAGDGERLQKVLAAAGIASRRECEQWILDGRVEIDKKVVTELGVRVNPFEQEIRVDGSPIKQQKRRYFLLNKPIGVVTTNRDPQGRTRVIDLIDSADRLFPVGRLDRSSEGLLLVTNDGALANQLAHPSFGVEKTYLATVAGRAERSSLQQLEEGVYFSDGKAKVVSVHIKKRLKDQTVLEIVLNEGRNREIRRLLAKVGHKVTRLKRVALGTIRLGDIPAGAYRELTSREVASLRKLVASGNLTPSRPRKRPASGAGAKRPTRSPRGASAKKTPRRRERLAEPAPPTGSIIGGELPAVPKKKKAKKASRRKPSASQRGNSAKRGGKPKGRRTR